MQLNNMRMIGLTAILLPLVSMPSIADEVADFYRGRTITMMISAGVGGGYNAFSRTLSRHMGKHIPGNPKFINTNKVGAGGLIAANYAYNKSPRDGSVIVGIMRSIPTNQLFGTKGTASVMDMSFAVQALTSEYSLKKDLDVRVHDVPSDIDELIAGLKLKSMNISIDTLTDEQVKYLSSWDQGT